MTSRIGAVRTASLFVGGMLVGTPIVAQTVVPIREMSAPTAVALQKFGNIESVHPQAGNGVLVNDSKARSLIALDSTLQRTTIVLDSMPDGTIRYGNTLSPLFGFRGDSSVFKDAGTNTMVIIDDHGNFARTLQVVREGQPRMTFTNPKGFDANGNPINYGSINLLRTPSGKLVLQDYVDIVRVNFESRKYEDIGEIQSAVARRTLGVRVNGEPRIREVYNPLTLADDWTVLSDGTIAFIRPHDYRVEMAQMNGKRISSQKLPFENRHLTDTDKQHIVDSMRVALQSTMVDSATSWKRAGGAAVILATRGMKKDSLAKLTRNTGGGFNVAIENGDGKGGASGALRVNGDSAKGRAPVEQPFSFAAPEITFVPYGDMVDHMPPFRAGAAKADVDSNLWILTTNIAGLKPGDALYDVINNRAQLVERVRVPAGREIAGFGHDGVVYLKHKDNDSWVLERRSVVRGKQN